MYEIYSLGLVPYDEMSVVEVKEILQKGERLPCPQSANETMYSFTTYFENFCSDSSML